MRLKVIALVLVGLLLGYSAYWIYLAQHADTYLRQLVTALAQTNGIALNYDSYRVSGYPYRLVLTFQNPVLTYRNGPLTADMAADELDAILEPWNLDHAILMSASSRTTIAFGTGEPTRFVLAPETLSLSVHAGGANALRVSVIWNKVRVESNAGAWVPADLGTLEFHLRKLKPSPDGKGQLFEPKALDLVLRAAEAPTGSLGTTLAFRGRDVPRVTRSELGPWRDQGGTLEVESFDLEGENVHVAASGSFTLDEDFRLLGAVDIKGISREDLANLFVAKGWMTTDQAGEFLSFYATLPPAAVPEGGESAISITAQDGWLSLGPVRFEPIGPVVTEDD
jgi:hypothetical protein